MNPYGKCFDNYVSDLNVGTRVLLPSSRSVFPYRSYWKGNPYDERIFIDDRRAGYRPRIDTKPTLPPIARQYHKPDYCWNFNYGTGDTRVSFPCGKGNYRSQVFRLSGPGRKTVDLTLATIGVKDEAEFF